jgi:parallel beta-helix repeat protein
MKKSTLITSTTLFTVIILGIIMIPTPNFTLLQNNFNNISHLKSSLVHDPLYIANNTELDDFCSGAGTDGLSWDTAHIIEDLELEGRIPTTEFDRHGAAPIELINIDRFLIIRNCVIYNSTWTMEGVGIYINRCKNIKITKCAIRDCESGGVIVRDSQDILVTENNFRNVIIGVDIRESSYINATSNTITNCQHGISITDADYNQISHNTVSKAGGYGIFLDSISNDNEVFNNCFKNCELGQFLDYGSNNNIHDNKCPPLTVPSYSSIIIISTINLGLIPLVIIVNRNRNK